MTDGGSSSNAIQGNFIGVDATGVRAIGDAQDGILIDGGTANTVGGSVASARNVISGNGRSGVTLRSSGTSGNKVQANWLGTDASGAVAIGNTWDGVSIEDGASGNVVGTDGDGLGDAAEGNLIAANLNNGVGLNGAGTDRNVIAGNRIGTDFTGARSLGGTVSGVWIGGGAANNRVGTDANGTSDALESNLISGLGREGVFLTGIGTTGNILAGNRIGTDANGTSAVPDAGSGVVVTGGASGNRIGGAGAIEGNLIANNLGYGISIESGPGNLIRGNSIFANLSGGIRVIEPDGRAARPDLGGKSVRRDADRRPLQWAARHHLRDRVLRESSRGGSRGPQGPRDHHGHDRWLGFLEFLDDRRVDRLRQHDHGHRDRPRREYLGTLRRHCRHLKRESGRVGVGDGHLRRATGAIPDSGLLALVPARHRDFPAGS